MKNYDFIFSLGAACSCSQSLRLANLQFASFPCDWLYGGMPETRARVLVSGFDALLNETRLVRHDIPWRLEHEPWRDSKTGIVFKHDFDWNTPIARTLPAVREKYARRLSRLSGLIGHAKNVLVVWVNPPACVVPPSESFVSARQILSSKWPNVAFDVVVTHCEKGQPFVRRTDTERDGIRTLAWDYDDGRGSFLDNAKMANFLGSEYATDDYRSEKERKAWPARRRALRYAQYNATSWFGYFVNRSWYRIYRHVRKEIERRGLHRLG